jgi:P-type E1-E2 ATPase
MSEREQDTHCSHTAGQVDVLLVDKTGTLTEGKPALTNIIAAAAMSFSSVSVISNSLRLRRVAL